MNILNTCTNKWFNLLAFICLLIFYSLGTAQQRPPDWAKGIVWYQIFPERFANADESNDPEPEKVFINSRRIPDGWAVTPWTSNWFEMSLWEKKQGGKVRDHLFQRRYGGDLQGIIDRLDYLKSLGVDGIYLNPVFEAVSLHKYDGSTFHHIDVNFGPDPDGDRELIQSEVPEDPSTWVWTSADKLFLQLISEIRSRDMRIIIDGVFNHTGIQFWAFQDIIKYGQNSVYKDWYMIESFDDPSTPEDEFKYKGWWNIASLPEFNRTENDLHPGPKQYIFHATKRWMDPNDDGDPSDGIDGWRLDVARDVPPGFWKDWSKLVKSINPQAIIVGELWELSPDFVSDDGVFDALMNYNFAYAVTDFFIHQKRKIKPTEFIEKLKEIDKTYPDENLHLLQNLMSSHDTDRLSSMIVNPDRDYDRNANESNPHYNPGKPSWEHFELQKLIAALQLTYRGAPMIYYGDEVGMWGADDPHCRKPMIWDELTYVDEIIDENSGFNTGHGKFRVEQNKDLLEFYKKIIAVRNNNISLKRGSLEFLYANDEKLSFVFERIFEDNRIIAAFNLGDEEDLIRVSANEARIIYHDLLNGEQGISSGSEGVDALLEFSLAPLSVKILKIYKHH